MNTKVKHSVITTVDVDGMSICVSISQKGLRYSTVYGKRRFILTENWDNVYVQFDKMIQEYKREKMVQKVVSDASNTI